MNTRLKNTLDAFYHDMTIAELRLQNQDNHRLHLTYNDMLYLILIDSHSGEYTASKIADMLYVSRPAVTQKINELERQGYIKKVQSPTDRRIYHLHSNRAQISNSYFDIVERTDQEIINKLSANYSHGDINLFCDMMEQLCSILLEEGNREHHT